MVGMAVATTVPSIEAMKIPSMTPRTTSFLCDGKRALPVPDTLAADVAEHP